MDSIKERTVVDTTLPEKIKKMGRFGQLIKTH